MISGEEPAQPFLRDIRFDRRGEKSLARFLDRLLVHIRGEDLDRRRLFQTVRVFAQQHRDRVRLFAGGAAGHPDAHLILLPLAGEELRHVGRECSEGFLIAEKMRHPDEQILKERAALRGMLAQEIEIFRNAFERINLEPPRDPAQHCRAFVMAEIVARLAAQMHQHIGERALVCFRARLIRDRLAAGGVRVLHVRLLRIGKLRREFHAVLVVHELHQFLRHLRDRQHPIHHPGADCRQRHAVVFRLARILRDRDSALRADVLQTDDAIRIASGENHADRALSVSLRQRPEKQIDRHAPALRLLRRHEVERALFKHELMIRRNDVNVIRFHLHWGGYLHHGH